MRPRVLQLCALRRGAIVVLLMEAQHQHDARSIARVIRDWIAEYDLNPRALHGTWIEDRADPARRVDDAHIVRGEN